MEPGDGLKVAKSSKKIELLTTLTIDLLYGNKGSRKKKARQLRNNNGQANKKKTLFAASLWKE